MESRIERTFLHPELSDVMLIKQGIEEKGLTGVIEIHVYNAQSNYKRSIDLQTKNGLTDIKQYAEGLRHMLGHLDDMILKSEYAIWKETHGEKLL